MWFYLMRCAGWLLWGPAANAAYGVGLCGAGLRQSGTGRWKTIRPCGCYNLH
jgi:hypothetical protein